MKVMSTNTVDHIINQALQQPARERARIAERLISSLDQTTDLNIELAWQKEIDKRLREIESGAVECIPWENVLSKLNQNANAQD
jgi:putative addiction module component (TIGR02574 family)